MYSLAGGEVTHRFDPAVLNVIRCNTFPVLNALMDFFLKGFSAKLTSQSVQSFQSLTGGVIDYIGMYTPKLGRYAQLIIEI